MHVEPDDFPVRLAVLFDYLKPENKNFCVFNFASQLAGFNRRIRGNFRDIAKFSINPGSTVTGLFTGRGIKRKKKAA